MTRDEREVRSASGPAALPELASPAPGAPPLFDHEKLGDLALLVEVPLGLVSLTLGKLASLRPGAVLRLERRTGEPLEISVNGTTIAEGDVRVHGERFAVRVTDILGAPRRDDLVDQEVPLAETSS